MVAGHQIPVGDDCLHIERAWIVHQQDVGNTPWGDGAYKMVDPVRFGAVDRSHLDGRHGSNPRPDGKTNQVVYMPFLNQVFRCNIIGAKAHTPGQGGIHLGHGADVFCKEMGYRRLADDHVHTLA
ncbi:hypothetical protein SDC9_141761 [bioreactor metagenome]|uniref:Uncharacterized protein n=1 Tax=bioreactor metagenome TaxID=1076179 RepID=A0A645E185_9ZZZZ